MGIIISSFKGCGREYLKREYGDKVKIFDAVEQIPLGNDADLEGYVNVIMSLVDDNDIVFIDSSRKVREAFDEKGIDYDVFYPSKDRRGEFLENQVKKRAKPNEIMELDRDFEKLVNEINNSSSSNCYKHKLSNFGEFIGNTPIILRYIQSLGEENKSNHSRVEDASIE